MLREGGFLIEATVSIDGASSPWVGKVSVDSHQNKDGGDLIEGIFSLGKSLGAKSQAEAKILEGLGQSLRKNMAQAALGDALEAAGLVRAAAAADKASQGRAMALTLTLTLTLTGGESG